MRGLIRWGLRKPINFQRTSFVNAIHRHFLEKHVNHIVKTHVLALNSTVLVQPGHFVEHTN
jgi:hypothetical protein